MAAGGRRCDTPMSFAVSKPALLSTLSASQIEAFIELRELCEKNNRFWSKSTTERSTGPDIDDDVTLLRYLRARNYDPQAAFKQYSTTASWRETLRLNDTYDNADISSFEATRRLFPQWTGRRSKSGVPIFVYVVSEIRPEDLLSMGARDPDLSSVFLPAEHATNFVYPVCARLHQDGIVSSSLNIIDLSAVGVRHFWNLRRLLQKSSTMATAHYPETVDKIFIIGAPAFFPTIWGFITKWFEPSTTSKILILSAAEVASTLTKFIDVEDLPKRFGGNHEWEFGMHPLLDEETKQLMGDMETEWVQGPMRCVSRDEKDVILALGEEDGRQRREVLATLI